MIDSSLGGEALQSPIIQVVEEAKRKPQGVGQSQILAQQGDTKAAESRSHRQGNLIELSSAIQTVRQRANSNTVLASFGINRPAFDNLVVFDTLCGSQSILPVRIFRRPPFIELRCIHLRPESRQR